MVRNYRLFKKISIAKGKKRGLDFSPNAGDIKLSDSIRNASEDIDDILVNSAVIGWMVEMPDMVWKAEVFIGLIR